MEGNGKGTQWYLIGMVMGLLVVTLIILMAIIFTFVLTVETDTVDEDHAAEVEDAGALDEVDNESARLPGASPIFVVLV